MLIHQSKNNLIDFSIATDPGYQDTWFHETLAAILQSAIKKVEKGEDVRIILECPPRHGKSEIATKKFPAWALGHHPEWAVIVASYSSDLATEFGQGTRDIMQSETYKEIFNVRLRSDTKAKGRWMTGKGGGYTAVGIGGSITGKGFKIGIIDDPFKNREEADSETIRNSRWDWYRSTFYTRREGGTAIIVINTRWHTDDLVGRILKHEEQAILNHEEFYDKWQRITFPAIAIEDEQFRKKGEALWASKFSIENLRVTENSLGPYEFSSLYQANPISSANQEFKEDWFKYRSLEEVEALDTRKFATIDPGGKGLQNDNTGIIRNYIDKQNKWNLRAMGVHFDSKELLDYIFKLHEEGFEKIGIEETVYLKAVSPFYNDECVKRNKFPNIIPLKQPSTQKEVRIRGLVPRYSAGGIYHIRNECNDLESELKVFPKGARDDVCFIAGTKIATIFGNKKIENMKKGDLVITPLGIKKVLGCGYTGKRKVIENHNLKGTPSHKIFTYNKGFVALDSLCLHNQVNRLSFFELFLWKYRNLLFSMGGNLPLWEDRKSIILVSQQPIRAGKIRWDYMWRFGNFTMRRKYLKVIVFTIKIEILLITTLVIWNVYLFTNTIKLLNKLIENGWKNIWIRFVPLQLLGISQKKEGCGIKSIIKSLRTSFIKNLIESVLSVEKSSKYGNTLKVKPVLEVVQQTLDIKQGVYNLTVEGNGVYYANGILVSNCDALAMQNEIAEAPEDDYKLAIIRHEREQRRGEIKRNYGL